MGAPLRPHYAGIFGFTSKKENQGINIIINILKALMSRALSEDGGVLKRMETTALP